MPDNSFRIRGRNILDLRLDGGQTVREYLAGLLHGTIYQPAGSGLIAPIRQAMIRHAMVDEGDQARAERLVSEAIEVLAAEPFRPVGVKTDTARHLARLQRRGRK